MTILDRGKYKGQTIESLTDNQLQGVWAAWNGIEKLKAMPMFADISRAHRRRCGVEKSSSIQHKYAKSNRSKKTPGEKAMQSVLMWWGIKFRSEVPCGKFLLDLHLYQLDWAVEVDGGYHDTPEQRAKDEKRSQFIRSRGIEVKRIANEDVLGKTQVLAKLLVEILRAEKVTDRTTLSKNVF